MKTIGVLSLQGGFQRHIEAIEKAGSTAIKVRYPQDLELVSGLVIPGGESTTIGKLLDRNGFLEPLSKMITSGNLPVFATCAGLILLADEILGSEQSRIGGLPIRVQRNAYGSQIDSFEISLEIDLDQEEPCAFQGIFIRAPQVIEIKSGVKVLASVNSRPVLLQYGKILAATFHPELSNSVFLHEFFINSLCS